MTDTPSSGASADASARGDPDALAAVTITRLDTPHPLSPAEAETAFETPTASQTPQPRPMPPMPPPATFAHDTGDPRRAIVDASVLKPSVTALVRWIIHGLGIWLISRGLSQGQEAGLEPILGGLTLSGGALAWSVLQKRLAARRIVRAARADPRNVVIRR